MNAGAPAARARRRWQVQSFERSRRRALRPHGFGARISQDRRASAGMPGIARKGENALQVSSMLRPCCDARLTGNGARIQPRLCISSRYRRFARAITRYAVAAHWLQGRSRRQLSHSICTQAVWRPRCGIAQVVGVGVMPLAAVSISSDEEDRIAEAQAQ